MRALPPGRIAFDLDDTLLRCDVDFPLEPAARPWLGWLWGTPPLRLGTRQLFATLQRAGWRPWVYTSSGRSPLDIHLTLLAHGLSLEGAVNCHRHEHQVKGAHRKLVKYPPAFGIDVLVDDSIAVAQQGEAHGFRVVRIDPSSATWVDEVLGSLGLLP
jgi:hypothetical protein